jgi:thiamine-monophosphate kinase
VNEDAFIAAMRTIATHPGARALTDDAAVIDVGGRSLVLTHDMLVEAVHFLPDDAPADVAWKLVAVNMSDLAAKGAEPIGILMGAGLAHDAAWARDFAAGLADAVRHFNAPLLGGDTVAMPHGAPVTLGLTAIGLAPSGGAPSRSGAREGDELWVSGTIGDAGLGLAMRQGQYGGGPESLAAAYTRPQPNLALGRALAPHVGAMADVSDGLLIDAQRIAAASGVAVTIAIDTIPLSSEWHQVRSGTADDRMDAATMGDDYQLLFTASPGQSGAILAAAARTNAAVTRVGVCSAGGGLSLTNRGIAVPLPTRLGYQHGR